MVLLTITPLILEALREQEEDGANYEQSETEGDDAQEEPSLLNPEIGKPISHGQIIDLSRNLKANGHGTYTLESLLKASRIYVPPPPPKPEPACFPAPSITHSFLTRLQTSEYQALMARLRQEEESRAYEQMTNPPPPMETFSQRFPSASTYNSHNSTEEDELTFSDINRQMTLIFNVLISIVCSSAALWIAARHWSTIARLSLSMSGSILIAVAEVAIYSGYMRRMGEAKSKEGKLKEVKEIVNTWVVGGDEGEKSEIIVSGQEDEKTSTHLRNKGRVKDGDM